MRGNTRIPPVIPRSRPFHQANRLLLPRVLVCAGSSARDALCLIALIGIHNTKERKPRWKHNREKLQEMSRET